MMEATQGFEAESSRVEWSRRRPSDVKRRIAEERYRTGESAAAMVRRHGAHRRMLFQCQVRRHGHQHLHVRGPPTLPHVRSAPPASGRSAGLIPVP